MELSNGGVTFFRVVDRNLHSVGAKTQAMSEKANSLHFHMVGEKCGDNVINQF